MANTSIQWTDKVWNPLRGCSMAKGSETGGCLNCYAARLAARNLPELRSPTTGESFARILPSGPRWTGKVELIESALPLPSKWRKPQRVFVNSMSDLFHESVPDETIDRVLSVMAGWRKHTYQVLTKRPERMVAYLDRFKLDGNGFLTPNGEDYGTSNCPIDPNRWPLSNVWFGVSVENQATADARIPLLLQAKVKNRFVSYEPALGPVDFSGYLQKPKAPYSLESTPARWNEFEWPTWVPQAVREQIEKFWSCFGRTPRSWVKACNEPYYKNPSFGETVSLCMTKKLWVTGRYVHAWNNIGRIVKEDGSYECVSTCDYKILPVVNWIIVGGESGPSSRPFDIEWARSTVRDCRAAGTPCFVKQIGTKPMYRNHKQDLPGALFNGLQLLHSNGYPLKDRKGGDMSEWPEDLRVREFPQELTA